MCFLIANAAQEYIVLTYEMGILHQRKLREPFIGKIDKTFIRKQKFFANNGLSDFAENF